MISVPNIHTHCWGLPVACINITLAARSVFRICFSYHNLKKMYNSQFRVEPCTIHILLAPLITTHTWLFLVRRGAMLISYRVCTSISRYAIRIYTYICNPFTALSPEFNSFPRRLLWRFLFVAIRNSILFMCVSPDSQFANTFFRFPCALTSVTCRVQSRHTTIHSMMNKQQTIYKYENGNVFCTRQTICAFRSRPLVLTGSVPAPHQIQTTAHMECLSLSHCSVTEFEYTIIIPFRWTMPKPTTGSVRPSTEDKKLINCEVRFVSFQNSMRTCKIDYNWFK